MLARALPRPGRLLLVVLVVYGFMWIKGWPKYYDDEELPPNMRPQTGTALGPHRVGPDHLVVGIMTTATNVYTTLAPSLAYLSEEDKDSTLIFGDLKMDIGDWPVFDVLYKYTTEFIGKTKQLARYRQLVEFARHSIPFNKIRKPDPEVEAEELAILDKFKILQAMASAWEYRPDRSWYAFVGDDTFVDRINTLDWLAQYNPKTKWFFGNPAVSGVPDGFSAGGSSFILSSASMKELFKEGKNILENWQDQIADYESAFDLVFSVLQAELNLSLTGSWPGISGADPSSVPFSPAVWCERVLMMHHVPPDVMSNLYLLQKNRTEDHIRRPLLFATLWERFMAPENLKDNRTDWDNLSSDSSNARWNILFESDDPNDGHAANGEASPEACEASCESSEYCMQWSYSSVLQKNWNENGPTKCHLSSSLRFGTYAPPQEWTANGVAKLQTWKSGWKKHRFMAWANHQRCKNPAH
ncbi:hypothetical protein GQ44DRAFT_514325 [Phaeosphaeriaceae sp. PMI808]|nr:hypothetical protein GQ44DRAFT_514325 [Phaeosphaeriaceae sp. PMI808]